MTINPLHFLYASKGFSSSAIPYPVYLSFQLYMRIHRIWKWRLETKTVLSSSEKTFGWLVGVSIYQLGGATGVKGIPIRFWARVTHVCYMHIKVKEQLNKTSATYEELKEVILFRKNFFLDKKPYSLLDKKWRDITELFLDSSSIDRLQYQCFRVSFTARETTRLSLQLSKDFFQLSNYSISLIESLSWSDQSTSHAVRMLLPHSEIILDKIAENKEQLLKDMKLLRESFHTYLHLNVDLLFDSAEWGIHMADGFASKENYAKKAAFKTVKIAGKGIFYFFRGSMAYSSLLFFNYVPPWLLDDERPKPQF